MEHPGQQSDGDMACFLAGMSWVFFWLTSLIEFL